jgi:hypothetical protein
MHRNRRTILSILALLVGAAVCAVSAYAYFSAPAGSATKAGSITGPTASGGTALAVSFPDGATCFDASVTSGASVSSLSAFGSSIRCKVQVTNPAGNATQTNIVVAPGTPPYSVTNGPSGTCPSGSYVVTFGDLNTSGTTATAAGGTATYTIASLASGASATMQAYVSFINLGASTNQDGCIGSTLSGLKVTASPS